MVAIQNHCEDSVTAWILSYASFPDTYKSRGFSDIGDQYSFGNGKEIVPLRKYSIEHTFEILNNKNETTNATLVFELNPDYFVQKVGYKTSNVFKLMTRVFPPDYAIFTDQYGRSYNAQDSIIWKNNNREILFQLADKFTDNRYSNKTTLGKVIEDSLIIEINKYYISSNK